MKPNPKAQGFFDSPFARRESRLEKADAALRQRDRVYGKDNQRDMLGFDARNAHVAGKLLSEITTDNASANPNAEKNALA